MEDIDGITKDRREPQSLADPTDPLRPDLEEENSGQTPSAGFPQQDTELIEDVEDNVEDDKDSIADDSSELSDVDERQLEDFDPTAIAIEDRPAIAVDETNVGLLKANKRTEGEDGIKKRKREGRREKPKKNKKKKDEDEVSAGEDFGGRRERRKRERVKPTKPAEDDDETLTPDERRRKALDRAMDEALRNPNRRRKGGDLERDAEEEVESMRQRMTRAAQADGEAREDGRPATHKLQLLPQVVALLNKNTLQNTIVDPDINLLEAVRFFLEPLPDASLPAHNIQRELFSALGKLPITKDALFASGIGKVVLFYTKSKRPEPGIRRQAEKMIQDWSRPILRRTDDYRKRAFAEASYDPNKLPVRTARPVGKPSNQGPVAPTTTGLARARVEGGPTSYTIAPKSNIAVSGYAKSASSSADKAFNRIKARQQGKSRGTR